MKFGKYTSYAGICLLIAATALVTVNVFINSIPDPTKRPIDPFDAHTLAFMAWAGVIIALAGVVIMVLVAWSQALRASNDSSHS